MIAIVRKLALAVTLATPMLACAEGSYLKLGVGRSTYDGGEGNFHETGYLLAYGAMADKNWGAEVGYVDFGSIGDGLDSDGNPASLKTRALYAAGIGAYPLSPQVAIYGKLGLAVKRYTAGSDSATKTSPLLGVGARWDFNRDWGVALEYTHYGKSEGLTLSQVSLSALYSF